MILQIQPNFPCENCIKCGKRPHVEQHKEKWTVACPDKNCKNQVKSTIADFTTWNRLNKKATTITVDKKSEKLKQTA
ncbi:hypothetical protein AAFN85_19380 [Mucilaginibacter sp. CAU 1740]|uniref:hypothetical protein n=1 Tax=Mucilaginibacter sp. CAU 1740 TaxID=3140365 RepID=UPI00325B8F52